MIWNFFISKGQIWNITTTRLLYFLPRVYSCPTFLNYKKDQNDWHTRRPRNYSIRGPVPKTPFFKQVVLMQIIYLDEFTQPDTTLFIIYYLVWSYVDLSTVASIVTSVSTPVCSWHWPLLCIWVDGLDCRVYRIIDPPTSTVWKRCSSKHITKVRTIFLPLFFNV